MPISFMRAVAMPASRAASSASPVAVMCRPSRVCFSTNSAISAAAAAHSTGAGMPSTLPRASAVNSAGQRPTKATPCVAQNAKPLAIAAVPSVAISEGIFSRVTSSPLKKPPTVPTPSPDATASGTG